MIEREFTERDIHLALDGEMPADERPAFERWLEAHPDMKARFSRFEADQLRLRETLDPILYERPPPALAGAQGVSGGTGRSVWWRAAAAAALLAAGGAAGYLLGTGNPFAEPEVARIGGWAIDAHLVYAAEKRHVVEVGADDKEHLVGWLSTRLGTDLIAPDFSSEGYSLIGGRLLPAGERHAAQFMYERADGDRISLYVTRDPAGREKEVTLRREDDGCAFYWLDNGYGFAVAGTSSEDTLLALANETQRQLPAAGS
jgi:anti-sigma factor RsiW